MSPREVPPDRPFDEPWQAQAFALTHALHDAGRFDWPDFSAALGAALRHDGADAAGYWSCWLAALESVVVARGLTSDAALADRRDAWREAARATPHGQPITLGP